jgi:CheY-like chemotaxis protein
MTFDTLAGSRGTVVVVAEDELLVRLAIIDALAYAGFEVVEAEHAAAALAHLQGRPAGIHALFTDVQMPGEMDGIALAHHTRQSWPWIVILVTSGKVISHRLPEGSRFLSKPYEADHVIRHLREMITDDAQG